MQGLAFEQLSEGFAFCVDGVQMSASLQECVHHIRLDGFVLSRNVEGKVVLVVSGLNIRPAFEKEGDDFRRRKLANGVSAHGWGVAGARQMEGRSATPSTGSYFDEVVDGLFDLVSLFGV